MIKNIIKIILFTSVSVNVAQYIIGGFFFQDKASIILYVIGISILYLFIKPLLSLISLPDNGIGFLFMSFLLILIVSFVLTQFIQGFNIRITTLSELIIFGFVLPSKQLNAVWSLIFSSLFIAVMMFFLNWLCDYKKK